MGGWGTAPLILKPHSRWRWLFTVTTSLQWKYSPLRPIAGLDTLQNWEISCPHRHSYEPKQTQIHSFIWTSLPSFKVAFQEQWSTYLLANSVKLSAIVEGLLCSCESYSEPWKRLVSGCAGGETALSMTQKQKPDGLLSRTKELGDKLEVVLNWMLSVCLSVCLSTCSEDTVLATYITRKALLLLMQNIYRRERVSWSLANATCTGEETPSTTSKHNKYITQHFVFLSPLFLLISNRSCMSRPSAKVRLS